MSRVNKNEVVKTCNDCYCYKQDSLIKPIMSLSIVVLILCKNSDSDHYCHYMHPDHPMCDTMLQNELEEKAND
jgi:hypothetical protein